MHDIYLPNPLVPTEAADNPSYHTSKYKHFLGQKQAPPTGKATSSCLLKLRLKAYARLTTLASPLTPSPTVRPASKPSSHIALLMAESTLFPRSASMEVKGFRFEHASTVPSHAG